MRSPFYLPVLSIALILGVVAPRDLARAADFPKFRAQTIDPNIGKVCYAVTVADVNGDGKRDIVAVSENRVVWYQAPDWRPATIIENQTPRDNVCIAAHDIDGDGKVDFALGAGWTRIGTIHWLQRRDSLDKPWRVHAIGKERWLHRMRFADVLAKGRPQLVISPLRATSGSGVRLTAFEIPKDPVQGEWKRTVLNQDLNAMHNHWHADFNRDGRIDTLTASQEGVHVVWFAKKQWRKQRLGTGAEGSGGSGAGEIKMGTLKGGRRFLTTVEPMHGHSLAIYLSDKSGGSWTRRVIDTGFKRGHALWTADLDDDGSDEIVFGHSDTPKTHGVIIYDAQNAAGSAWKKHPIDVGGIATEDLRVADLNGDGRPDIVAGGRATHNVKLYVNTR